MGVNAQAQSKLITAQKYLRESLKIFIAIHDITQAALVQRHLRDIAHQQQRYPNAIDHYLAGLSVLETPPLQQSANDNPSWPQCIL